MPLFAKLSKAVNFEDLAACDAIKHLSVDDVVVEGRFQEYFFQYGNIKALKAEKWREMSLCFINIKTYDKVFNSPDKCTFFQIKDIKNDVIYLEGNRRIKQTVVHCGVVEEENYHVDFLPNRIGVRACLNALEAVNNQCSMQKLFLDFDNANDDVPYNFRVCSSTLKENFEWFNKNISTNLEQQMAIKNIFNRSARPLPFVVFGPPGRFNQLYLIFKRFF